MSPTQHVWPPAFCHCWSVRMEQTSRPCPQSELHWNCFQAPARHFCSHGTSTSSALEFFFSGDALNKWHYHWHWHWHCGRSGERNDGRDGSSDVFWKQSATAPTWDSAAECSAATGCVCVCVCARLDLVRARAARYNENFPPLGPEISREKIAVL